MKKVIIATVIILLLFSTLNFASSEPDQNNNEDKVDELKILENFKSLDGHFTENQGQVEDDSVRYYIQGNGVWFLDDGVIFEFIEPIVESEIMQDPSEMLYPDLEPEMPVPRKSVVLKLNFEGCNEVKLKGVGMLPHRSNYFYGNDPSKWCTDVPNFQELIYEDIYDNIDLRYYSSDLGLKYDFIVHPGGDPNKIRLSYQGADNLEVDIDGNLIIKTGLGCVIDSSPVIYQDSGNIFGNFQIIDSTTVGFKVQDDYDKTQDLIIDPLFYSTYLGGSAKDEGLSIVINSTGCAVVSGRTYSSNFTTTPGVFNTSFSGMYDMFLTKLDPTGATLIFSTYIGGSGVEYGSDSELDSSDNIYLLGYTNSSDFPTTAGAFSTTFNNSVDGYVLKINAAGNSLIYSTYIGGTDDDWLLDLDIDTTGNAYASGFTASTDFPTSPGAYNTSHAGGFVDLVVLKLTSTGAALIYSTYVGGSNVERSYGLEVDDSGYAYIAGYSESNDFPTSSGAFNGTKNTYSDVIVFKLNPTGSSLVYSTYVGGSDSETALDLDIDSWGYAYIFGWSQSNDFPTTPGSYDPFYSGKNDAILFKLNQTGGKLIYSTFIGSSNSENGVEIRVGEGNISYVTGQNWDGGFPTTPGAYDTSHNGMWDVFFCKINATGQELSYSTYIGGSDWDESVHIAIDNNMDVYLTGETMSEDFPVTPGANDTSYNNNSDAFVLKLGLQINNKPNVTELNITEKNVFRTQTIFIYVNGNDTEDAEKNLTPHFEHKHSSSVIWTNTYFSNPIYNNSQWEVSFTPPLDAMIGVHDVRVRFNDTGSMYSNWKTDFLYIKNNPPITIDMKFSNNMSIQNNNVSIWVNGSDIEDVESNLTVELYHRDSNGQFWNNTYLGTPQYVNNRWEVNFSVPKGGLFGDYDFRVRVNDSDGNYSDWLYSNDSVKIYNLNPMIIDINLSKTIMYRTETVFVLTNSTDHETFESVLDFYCQYKHDSESSWHNLSGFYNNGRWIAGFATNISSQLGIYDFRVKFDDPHNGTTGWGYLNDSLTVLNNPPNVVDITLSNNTALLGNIVNVWVNLTDIEEQEQNLTLELEYQDPDQQMWNTTYLSGPIYLTNNWELLFTIPFEALFGNYSFRARCNDSEGNYSEWFYLNDSFAVINTDPGVVDMNISRASIYRTDSVFFYVNGTDYETPENMLVFYVQYKPQSEVDWTDLTGTYLNNTWEVALTTNEGSTLGYYDFRVKFEDNETASSGWEYFNDSLDVLNNIPEVQDLSFSEISVYRTNSVIISVNGTDVEDQEDFLSCEVQVKAPSTNWSDICSVNFDLDHWEAVFTPNTDAELGNYDARVNFTDMDGGYSGWAIAYEAFEVKNNPPSISEDLDDIEVGIQPLIFDLTPYESDIEDMGPDLTWAIVPQVYSYIESIGIIDTVNDTLEITPKENVTGAEDIVLTLIDKDSGATVKSDITINIDSTISDNTPKVTLLSPVDSAVINTLTPILKWELDYSGARPITYTVKIDGNPDPQTTIQAGLSATEYTLENELVDDKTYYWTVEPTNGICISDYFMFTVDLDFDPIYKVDLNTEEDMVTIKQGYSKDINLTVKNEGNSYDIYNIELSSANLLSYISIDDHVHLDPDWDQKIILSIDIPVDFAIGDYSITVTATSLTDDTAEDQVTIDVEVVSKDYLPEYDVSISVSPPSLELEPGETDDVVITITNDGNVEDDFTVSFESTDFTSTDITFSESYLPLTDEDSDTIIVTIKIPEDMEPGNYMIKFIVESNGIPKESTLTITVPDIDGRESKDGGEDNTMLYAGIGILVIIIIIALILFFIFLKRKKEKEEEPSVEEKQPLPTPAVIPQPPPPTPVQQPMVQQTPYPPMAPAPQPQVTPQIVPTITEPSATDDGLEE